MENFKTYIKTISDISKLQNEYMKEVFKNPINEYFGIENMMNKMYLNPLEMYKIKTDSNSDIQKIMENNLKFHTSFINYHTSIRDMIEVMNDNFKILKNIKE